mgnify:CR=1 FL=1
MSINIPLQRKNERRARIGMSPYQAPDPQSQDMTKALLDWASISMVPVASDAAGLLSDARMYQTQPESRGLLNYGLTALGVLPFIPSASMVRKAIPGADKRIADRGLLPIQKNMSDDIYSDYGVQSDNNLTRGFLSTKRDTDLAGNPYIVSMDTKVDPGYQGQGLGTDLYDAIEQMEGVPFAPDQLLTEAGAGFWSKRNPELLQGLLDSNKYFSEGTESIVRDALRKVPTGSGMPDWYMSLPQSLKLNPKSKKPYNHLPHDSSTFSTIPAASQKTQVATTSGTYKKAQELLPPGKTLDYGSGRGIGAKEVGSDTFEPFAREGFDPTFANTADIPASSYDNVTSFNVLNVVPEDVRTDIVKEIGRVLKPGGTAVISTRGKDVMSAHGMLGPENLSIKTSAGTYQKGFMPDELQGYVQSVLGDGYIVEKINLGPAGVIIKKQ